MNTFQDHTKIQPTREIYYNHLYLLPVVLYLLLSLLLFWLYCVLQVVRPFFHAHGIAQSVTHQQARSDEVPAVGVECGWGFQVQVKRVSCSTRSQHQEGPPLGIAHRVDGG